jgi:hypothetical protein
MFWNFNRINTMKITPILGVLLLAAHWPLQAESTPPAIPLGNAKVSFIQKDVTIADIQVMKVQDGQVAKHPAKLKDPVTKDQVVVTGTESRAELTFDDGTIARVGQHSVFSFSSQSRNMSVDTGSALFHVPKNHGGTQIKVGPVTASIVGTTLLVQSTDTAELIYVYEGTVIVDGITLTAGQCISIDKATGAKTVKTFDVNAGMQLAGLFSKFEDADSQSVIEIAIKNNVPQLPKDTQIVDDNVLQSRFHIDHTKPKTPVNPPTYTPPPPPPPVQNNNNLG